MPDVGAIIALGAAADAAALETARLEELMGAAEALALRGFGPRVSYSRKVFIPLTKLCRDACGYCTFAQPPRQGARAFLAIDEVVAIATAGAAAGCQEALFTLGDRPEHRYPQVRDELAQLGAASTIEYLAAAASAVIARTTLLPHLNPGVMSAAELARLKPLAVSMGLMLESTAVRLLRRGGAHWRSPDKHPQARLATLRAAGELGIPFTTGLLVGIGETRRERIESLLAIRELQQRHGHIQEVIIQNFRAKPGTRMAQTPDAPLAELLWTIAVARLLLGESMSIQAPPNLSPGELEPLIRAGINDWGGVSPVTCDHVNPEAPWPQLALLEHATERAGRILVERLALVPRFACEATRWAPAALHASVLRRIDAAGYPRRDAWHAGAGDAPPAREVSLVRARTPVGGSSEVRAAIARVTRGQVLPERELAALFLAEGADLHALVRAADELRAHSVGDDVTYVVNRNINYTNVCVYACGFCAFAKGRSARSLRGPAYELDLQEIARRTQEAA
ncbi:MAG TPA: 7,8-didemethyl-8-hydroxy-5-deazariboflavin synthase CofG, partial [Steroidobacteraceae bacterium]